MPPKGKKDATVVKKEYSEVNVCWKRDKEAAAEASTSGQIDEGVKKTLLLQITELQNRTERLQLECDAQKVANEQFIPLFEQIHVDQKDIVNYLQDIFENRDREVPGLKQLIADLEDKRSRQDQKHTKELQDADDAMQAMINKLKTERILLVNKLKAMIQIQEDKTEIETKIATLEHTIKEHQKKHLDALYAKERQHDMECQYARRSMESQIETVVKERGEAETQRMKIVTASALKDSAEMYVLLSNKIQPKIGKLMHASTELNTRNKSRRLLVLSLVEYTDKVREKDYQQVQTIQDLVIKNNEMDDELAELEGQFRKQAAKFEELKKRLNELAEELTENSAQIATMTVTNAEMKSTLSETAAQLAKVNAKNWRIAMALSSTCATLDKFLIRAGYEEVMEEVKSVLTIFAEDLEEVSEDKTKVSKTCCCAGEERNTDKY